MCRLALGAAQLEVPRPPLPVGGEVEPSHDQSIDVLEHEDFGQHKLFVGPELQFANCVIRDSEQLRPRDLLLELLNPLEDKLLILLTE